MVKSKFYVKLLVAILIGIGSWALFSLIKLLFINLLSNLGINSEILQLVILISLISIVLVVLGVSFKKQIRNMVG